MKKCIAILLLLIALGCLAFSQALQITHYTLSSEKITQSATLAVVSDLHSSIFGNGQSRLIEAIRAEKPDAVLLTGDMTDTLHGLAATQQLVEGLSGETPIFFVSGNHECASGKLDAILNELRNMGVRVLRGESEILPCGLRIAGADDPLCLTRREWRDQMDSLRARDDRFTVLLSHRPDRIDFYREGFDLILTGHAHGGQIRIPLLLENGLWSPNQGFFPAYTTGMHDAGEGKMIISRGMSKGFPPRIFNRPELVIVHLNPQ